MLSFLATISVMYFLPFEPTSHTSPCSDVVLVRPGFIYIEVIIGTMIRVIIFIIMETKYRFKENIYILLKLYTDNGIWLLF